MTVDLKRREVIVAAVALAAATSGLSSAPATAATQGFDEALAKLLSGRQTVKGGIDLQAPEVAEDGNMVAVTVAVEGPTTGDAAVRSVTLLATRNPVPLVARYHFTPLSGQAFASSRIRLSESQHVVAIAELADGSLREARREVRVTVGGCGAA